MTPVLIDIVWIFVAVVIVLFTVWAILLVTEAISDRSRDRARRKRRMACSIEETAKRVRELERVCAVLVLREQLDAERDEVAKRMAAALPQPSSEPGRSS